MNKISFVQKFTVAEAFDLSRLMQTMHAFFTENPETYATALERKTGDYSIFVYSHSQDKMNDLADYVESNRYLRQVSMIDRVRSVPSNVNLVEYRRVRIPSPLKLESDCEYYEHLINNFDKDSWKLKSSEKRQELLDKAGGMRHIHMKSSSSGNAFRITVKKNKVHQSCTSSGEPDSYGFSGKEHTVLVPDPLSIFDY